MFISMVMQMIEVLFCHIVGVNDLTKKQLFISFAFPTVKDLID